MQEYFSRKFSFVGRGIVVGHSCAEVGGLGLETDYPNVIDEVYTSIYGGNISIADGLSTETILSD